MNARSLILRSFWRVLGSCLAFPCAAPIYADRAPEPRPAVYAWFPARFGSWSTDGVRWDCLTHLCFRSVVITADGTLRKPAGDPPREFVDTAHRHGVKVTVLAWVDSAADSDGYLAGHPQEAADNLLAYVQANRLDGVNIDDEQMREQNAAAHAPNRDLVTRFFRIVARTFRSANPSYHLSFAAPPVISPADRYAASWLDLRAIADSVDAIIPMGYMLNPPSIGWTTNVEPLEGGGKAPNTTTRDVATMVRDYLAAMGGRREKLLVGVSVDFSGYEWRCRTDAPLSPTLGKGTPRSLAECEAAAPQNGRRWDARQRSPWYVHKEGDGYLQGWYSDLESWNARLDWVKAQRLGGIGLWVLDGVHDPPQRWQALARFRSQTAIRR